MNKINCFIGFLLSPIIVYKYENSENKSLREISSINQSACIESQRTIKETVLFISSVVNDRDY